LLQNLEFVALKLQTLPHRRLAGFVDIRGLHTNVCRSLSKVASETGGRLEVLPLQRQPLSVNCLYQAKMNGMVAQFIVATLISQIS
jgi:hypothetical protein